jgi:UDP-N-acetylglucosamine acyltransferase
MTALVSKKARISERVSIGAGTIIEDDVTIGTGTHVGNYVVIHDGSVIGEYNRIHSGVHIGVEPQDYHYQGEKSKCIIGDFNTIREYATLSRATGENSETIVGSRNFIMTYVHIAHNCMIDSDTVIASGVQIGGYVTIGDHVNIGGLTGIHQFCQVGAYAMLGAKSYLNQDLLPFLLAQGDRACLYGVNTRGLQRNGFSSRDIELIKTLYRPLLQARTSIEQWVAEFAQAGVSDMVKAQINGFVKQSKRGILLRRAGHDA